MGKTIIPGFEPGTPKGLDFESSALFWATDHSATLSYARCTEIDAKFIVVGRNF